MGIVVGPQDSTTPIARAFGCDWQTIDADFAAARGAGKSIDVPRPPDRRCPNHRRSRKHAQGSASVLKHKTADFIITGW